MAVHQILPCYVYYYFSISLKGWGFFYDKQKPQNAYIIIREGQKSWSSMISEINKHIILGTTVMKKLQANSFQPLQTHPHYSNNHLLLNATTKVVQLKCLFLLGIFFFLPKYTTLGVYESRSFCTRNENWSTDWSLKHGEFCNCISRFKTVNCW